MSFIKPTVYLLTKIYENGVVVNTAPELCQKCDFFLKKMMKVVFVYVLEFMLTFNKMQNTGHLMCTKFEI